MDVNQELKQGRFETGIPPSGADWGIPSRLAHEIAHIQPLIRIMVNTKAVMTVLGLSIAL